MEDKFIDDLFPKLKATVGSGANIIPVVELLEYCQNLLTSINDEKNKKTINSILNACNTRILSESDSEEAEQEWKQNIEMAFGVLPEKLSFLKPTEKKRDEFIEGSNEPIPLDNCLLGCDFAPQKFQKSCPCINETTDHSLIDDFLRESREHLENVEKELLQIDENNDPQCLHSIFRSFHTIKGVSAFLGFGCLKELTHSLENLVDKLRSNTLSLDSEIINLLLDGVDFIGNFLNNTQFLEGEELNTQIPKIDETLFKIQKCVEDKLEQKNGKRIGEILISDGNITNEQVEEALQKQNAGDKRQIGEILQKEQGVPAKVIDSAVKKQKNKKSALSDQTIRISVDKLENLMDAVGEVGVAFSMFSNDPSLKDGKNASLYKKLSRANMLMRQVQGLTFSLRMVSINSLFQKAKRLAWDLGRSQGKLVRIIMEGENTEIDKSMVERLGDPLVHLVRNAMDHGVETSQDRAQSGKTQTATIRLKAYHKSGNVFIEIQDDGRGLDCNQIWAKAVERGILTENQELDTREIQKLIFHPGFSTATKVTDLSGRGVGMDVVKQNLEAMGGIVDIQSAHGSGTTIILRLPLTTANVNGMVVRAGKEKYILPTLSILETSRISIEKIQYVMNKDRMIELRGRLTPVYPLEELVGLEAFPKDQVIIILLEDVLGRRFGIMVDEILEQQNVVIKQVGEGLGRIPIVAGGAIMADGGICLVLDVNGMAKITVDGEKDEQIILN